MKVLLFGGTGMVGQGVLRACEQDPEIDEVLAVGRSALPDTDEKVWEIASDDLFALSGEEDQLTGFDVCFFCLGVSSSGLAEEQYRRITYDMTLNVARTLLRLNPGMVFEYVSGAGTDSSEKGRAMWARVKGKTENDLLTLGFKDAYMFRPGIIMPMDGIKSKTRLYRLFYIILGPVLPILKRVLPAHITSTRELGTAMIRVAKVGFAKPVIEARDIGHIAEQARSRTGV